MAGELEMSSSSIRFTQNDISKQFTKGDLIHDVIDQIMAGRLSHEDFLPIEVAQIDGQWYTGNNRSLYVFRVLEYEGRVTNIRVKSVKQNAIWHKRSSTNGGTTVTMRGGVVRPHSIEEIEENKRRRQIGVGLVTGGAGVAVVAAAVAGIGFWLWSGRKKDDRR